jgi:hypothetical protein
MDDTNKKYSQNDTKVDLVCTPLKISPMIESKGDLLQHWLVGALELDCLHVIAHLVEMIN